MCVCVYVTARSVLSSWGTVLVLGFVVVRLRKGGRVPGNGISGLWKDAGSEDCASQYAVIVERKRGGLVVSDAWMNCYGTKDLILAKM